MKSNPDRQTHEKEQYRIDAKRKTRPNLEHPDNPSESILNQEMNAKQEK